MFVLENLLLHKHEALKDYLPFSSYLLNLFFFRNNNKNLQCYHILRLYISSIYLQLLTCLNSTKLPKIVGPYMKQNNLLFIGGIAPVMSQPTNIYSNFRITQLVFTKINPITSVSGHTWSHVT
jgi:hypothetical protein